MNASKLSIGVRWFPRKVETFTKMAKTIGHSFTVYPDGIDFKHPTNEKVVYLGERKGCFRHYYRTLKDLTEQGTEYVAALEDDIIYSRGWFEKIEEKLSLPDTGFVALFTPTGLAKRNGWSKGWHEVKGGWAESWGGSYVMRTEVANKILEMDYVKDHYDNYGKNQQIDHAIPEAVHRLGLKQWHIVPSLIDHIGFTSTIGHRHRKEDNGYLFAHGVTGEP